jgi:DNA-binding MarR family transcriptional regulator
MGIENDIHQVHFRNEHQKASINLLYTYGWMMERIKEFLAEDDITPQQFNILRILRGSHPAPLSTLQIRSRMLDKMSDTSRIVDRLLVKGLAKKTTCEKDRRLVDVIITEKGLALLSKLDERQEELDHIFHNLTEKEAGMLSKLLDKIRTAPEQS